MIRLQEVLKDLNIKLDRAKEFIFDATGEELGGANSKITQVIINLLNKEFQVDRLEKTAVLEINKENRAIALAKRNVILEDIETVRDGYKPNANILKVFFDNYNLIKSRSNIEWLKTSQQPIIDAFERMINVHKNNKLPVGYKSELTSYLDELYKIYPSIKKNFYVDNKLGQEIKDIDRQDNEDRQNDISYENFSWGGLTGEEANIGYWNTD